ncbi:hypothetical protein EB796_003309 [Bugula neritina]|uniref:PH domain-containing protein n=1 Tax=Bugula neritina TaxID=10212 RepID=A0A7J7KLG3_BUGNE|nr:hypothetical protein EB796_003309 [Bugula neritina]
MQSIVGWMVIHCPRDGDEAEHFKITSGEGSVYKFLAATPTASLWAQKLQATAASHNPKVPENLIHFH